MSNKRAAAASGLTASQQDYLEAILQALTGRPSARVRDVARRLHVSAPSVTGALRVLSARGLVRYQPREYITLTPAGRLAARAVSRRHEVLRDFFVRTLGADPREADACACRIEHVISDEVFGRLCRFLKVHRGASSGGDRRARKRVK